MRYTLGTIVGTALLGLAKKHSGSSVKMRKLNVYAIEYSYFFELDNDFYWDLVDNPELKSDLFNGFYEKLSSVNSANVHLQLLPHEEELDEEDYQEENRGGIHGGIQLVAVATFPLESYIQSLQERPSPADVTAAENIFNTEKNKFIEYMREEWQLNLNYGHVARPRTHFGMTGIFFQRNGEWVPYKKPESKSNLRKR